MAVRGRLKSGEDGGGPFERSGLLDTASIVSYRRALLGSLRRAYWSIFLDHILETNRASAFRRIRAAIVGTNGPTPWRAWGEQRQGPSSVTRQHVVMLAIRSEGVPGVSVAARLAPRRFMDTISPMSVKNDARLRLKIEA